MRCSVLSTFTYLSSLPKACCDLQASSCISTPVGWSWTLAASCLWGRQQKLWSTTPPMSWGKKAAAAAAATCYTIKQHLSLGFLLHAGNPRNWVTVEWMPRGCCCVKCLLISEAFRLGWQWHTVFSQGSGSLVTHGFGCTRTWGDESDILVCNWMEHFGLTFQGMFTGITELLLLFLPRIH